MKGILLDEPFRMMAPPMQNEVEDAEDEMIGLIVAVAGTLLLVTAGRGRKPAPQPVRVKRDPKR